MKTRSRQAWSDDVLTFLLEIVVHGLGSGGHRLEETVLVVVDPLGRAATRGMDPIRTKDKAAHIPFPDNDPVARMPTNR